MTAGWNGAGIDRVPRGDDARVRAGPHRSRGVSLRDLAIVVQDCGPQALGIVTLINFLVGVIVAFVGAIELRRFGAAVYVADLVAIATVRELGCIMTGIIMAGRTGSGFAAELGTMNVNQEIEALVTMGIPPMEFLVVPRVLALCVMMPLLCLYADLIGILGGAAVAVGMLGQSPLQYWVETRQAIGFTSIGLGIGKSIVFGALIAASGCLRGMKSGRDAAAVGRALRVPRKTSRLPRRRRHDRCEVEEWTTGHNGSMDLPITVRWALQSALLTAVGLAAGCSGFAPCEIHELHGHYGLRCAVVGMRHPPQADQPAVLLGTVKAEAAEGTLRGICLPAPRPYHRGGGRLDSVPSRTVRLHRPRRLLSLGGIRGHRW